MTINKKEIKNNVMLLECCNGDIELAIPLRGDSLDTIRTKVKINVSNKYTTNDIHVLQEKVFKELGVNTSLEEIEKRNQ